MAYPSNAAPTNGTSSRSDALHASNIFDISRLTVVLTGCGSGIGLMILQALVANGAKVYAAEIRSEALNTVYNMYNTGPGIIIPLVYDISDKSQVLKLATHVAASEPNGIQLLINNAGVTWDVNTEFEGNGTPDFTSADAISEHFLRSEPEAWTKSYAVNVMGVYWMCMAFLPLLARGHGVVPGHESSVINLSSNSGFLKDTTRGHIAYCASKAATAHLSRMLATTFAQTRVRVNTIAPGTFPTEMTAGKSGPDQKSVLERKPKNLAGRAGCETDIAATVLFLAGPGGTYYNHQILFLDGGETLINAAAM